MFHYALLVYSEKTDKEHINMVKKVKDDIEKFKINIVNTVNVKHLEKKYFENIDLVVAVGGDGTFIRASHFIKDIPILGINSEPDHSEGALLIRYEQLCKILLDNLNGKTKLNKRDRIQVIRNSVLLDELALNEVYIGAERIFKTSKYIINYRDNSEEHRSNGVLVVTASGSHAWYSSAKGEPFDDKVLKFLVLLPYFGKIYNPKILDGEILPDEKIIFYSRRYDDGVVAFDSNKIYPFNIGDVVEIKMSDIPLKIVSP